MEYYNSENKAPVRWGLIAAAIYFATLTVLLLTVSFSTSLTDPETQGILIEFGETEEGAGEEELLATDVAATPPTPQPEQDEEPLEVDDRSDVAVEQPELDSKQSAETPQVEQPIEQRDTIIPEERVVNKNAYFPGRKEQSKATSQGSTESDGNQGAQSGSESGAAEGGGSDGDMASVVLKNRSLVNVLPEPSYNPNARVTVVINIIVDETGRVKSASIEPKGTTTSDMKAKESARQSALKARFTPSEEFIQGGSITYKFIPN